MILQSADKFPICSSWKACHLQTVYINTNAMLSQVNCMIQRDLPTSNCHCQHRILATRISICAV